MKLDKFFTKPNKKTVNYTLRIPEATYERLIKLAKEKNLSINKTAVACMDFAIAECDRAK